MNWVYLVRCADNSLYAGWTNHLENRVKAHSEGRGAKYTRSRRPVKLVYAQDFETRAEAMAEEARLKKLNKAQKEALAQGWRSKEKKTIKNEKEERND